MPSPKTKDLLQAQDQGYQDHIGLAIAFAHTFLTLTFQLQYRTVTTN